MLKPLFSKTAVLTSGVLFVLHCYSLTPADTAGSSSVDQLRQWNEKIDSLEVEKQAKKRNGLPLAELETETARLRDSIKSIRTELGPETVPHSTAVPQEIKSIPEYLKKLASSTENKMVDRILLFAGAIAIITGLFFLFLLLALKSRRKKQPRNQTKKIAARYEEVQRKVAAAQSVYPDSFSNTPSESAALASAIPPVSPPPLASPVSPTRRMPVGALPSDHDLEGLVLKAGSEGMDAKEISRRYHISVDQVVLMLKMAKK